jgi:hypothetical protein
MYGASQARVKGMDRPQNLNRLFDVRHWRANQSLLK